jgi:2-amino-4-hydroxy-6-hydroxymethyldihydropteridine diphosphokinase
MNTAVISVGSNINSHFNIKIAEEIISRELNLLRSSKLIETEPIGFKDQNNFHNGAFLIETELDLKEFNAYLKKIETEMGRVKTSNKQGPRIIDLDIIVWNRKVVDNDVYERKFLQKIILELLPNFNL